MQTLGRLLILIVIVLLARAGFGLYMGLLGLLGLAVFAGWHWYGSRHAAAEPQEEP